MQLPSALPALFASLRIAAPLALIGALLAEWLATGHGLGYLMLQSETLSNYNLLWAATVLVTAYSVLLYTAISGVEKRVLVRFSDAVCAVTSARAPALVTATRRPSGPPLCA